MLIFKKRISGHLYQESIQFPDPVTGHEVSAVLIADSLSKAKVVGPDGTELATGSLEFEKASDAGRPTRILVFVSRKGRNRYPFKEEYLSAGNLPLV